MISLRRLLIWLEVFLLFGPAALLASIGLMIFFRLSEPIALLVSIICWGIPLFFGMYSVYYLAENSVDRKLELPNRKLLFTGLGAGVFGCIANACMLGLNHVLLLICAAPIIGAIHLVWICRDEIWRSA